jgi:hypothetical protein
MGKERRIWAELQEKGGVTAGGYGTEPDNDAVVRVDRDGTNPRGTNVPLGEAEYFHHVPQAGSRESENAPLTAFKAGDMSVSW